MDLEDGLIRCRMPLKEIGPACRTRAVLHLRGLLILAVARLSTLTLQMRRQPVAGWSTEALSHKSVLRGWFTTPDCSPAAFFISHGYFLALAGAADQRCGSLRMIFSGMWCLCFMGLLLANPGRTAVSNKGWLSF